MRHPGMTPIPFQSLPPKSTKRHNRSDRLRRQFLLAVSSRLHCSKQWAKSQQQIAGEAILLAISVMSRSPGWPAFGQLGRARRSQVSATLPQVSRNRAGVFCGDLDPASAPAWARTPRSSVLLRIAEFQSAHAYTGANGRSLAGPELVACFNQRVRVGRNSCGTARQAAKSTCPPLLVEGVAQAPAPVSLSLSMQPMVGEHLLPIENPILNPRTEFSLIQPRFYKRG